MYRIGLPLKDNIQMKYMSVVGSKKLIYPLSNKVILSIITNKQIQYMLKFKSRNEEFY